jgi:DNA mismatch repair ATPase MutL
MARGTTPGKSKKTSTRTKKAKSRKANAKSTKAKKTKAKKTKAKKTRTSTKARSTKAKKTSTSTSTKAKKTSTSTKAKKTSTSRNGTAAARDEARAERRLSLAAYWAKLAECGWLAELTPREQAELRDRLTKGLTDNPDSAFYELAVTALDVECIEGSGPDEICSYHGVIQQLARASAGLFSPEEIKDELDEREGKARLSFRCGGQIFSCELPYQSDFVEEGAIDLVNEALAATGEPRRFVPLPVDSQVVFFALISPETYDRARTAGLIPPDDYFFSIE